VLEQQVPDRHHGAEPEGARGEQQALHAGIDRRCLGDDVEPWAATEEAQSAWPSDGDSQLSLWQ
jgi:hypothetical protein